MFSPTRVTHDTGSTMTHYIVDGMVYTILFDGLWSDEDWGVGIFVMPQGKYTKDNLPFLKGD